MKLSNGYAYRLAQRRDWRDCPDEEWVIRMISDNTANDTKMIYLGIRRIDGTRCAVFSRTEGTYYAQTLVACGSVLPQNVNR
jgi:hypothetical protein